MDEFRKAIGEARRAYGLPLFIGGKSMGGRIASMIADEMFAEGTTGGLVCLGYPFHPAGKPGSLRVAHLTGMVCPTLIVQGTRDALGSREDVAGYALSPAIRVEWLDDGDHDFKARKLSGFTQADHIAAAAAFIGRFVGEAG